MLSQMTRDQRRTLQQNPYTYLNTKTGTEVSATLGLTGIAEDPAIRHTKATDLHLDLGDAQFLSEQFFVERAYCRAIASLKRSSGEIM
jgi:hypothetical protein